MAKRPRRTKGVEPVATSGPHVRRSPTTPQRASVPASAPFPKILGSKKRAVLLAYAVSGSSIKAEREAGVGEHAARYWRKTDPDFAAAWEEAREMAAEALECEAIRRATEGVRKAIFHKGEVVGHETNFSDTLLIFLLKGAYPEKYKDRYQLQHTGSIELMGRMKEIDSLPDAELEALVIEAERYAISEHGR